MFVIHPALLLKAFLEGISELLILVLGLNSKKGSLVSDLSEPPSYILGLLIQILGGAIPSRNSIPSAEFTPVNRSHLHVSHTASAEPPTSSWKDLWTDVPPSEPQAYPTLSSETVGSKMTIIKFTVMRLTTNPLWKIPLGGKCVL